MYFACMLYYLSTPTVSVFQTDPGGRLSASDRVQSKYTVVSTRFTGQGLKCSMPSTSVSSDVAAYVCFNSGVLLSATVSVVPVDSA